jgi:lipase
MHGRHFRELAETWLASDYRVLAPDLLGHGSSPYEPPWSIDAHVDAVLKTIGREPAAWVGHSFGGRLALEVAAHEPSLVRTLVLLDPAVLLPPHVALFAAENARRERTYASFAEAIDRRYEESSLRGAPRTLLEDDLRDHLVLEEGAWRYRYCQAAVVTAYAELATQPPSFSAVRAPTLLLRGAHSYLGYEHLLEAHREAAGQLLTEVTVDGGHSVLWDAASETGGAIAAFLTR